MNDTESLEQSIADAREHVESVDEEMIRMSMDTLRHCAEQTGKLEVLRIQRSEHKKTLLHRFYILLGNDDSNIDSFYDTLLEANEHMREQAKEILDEAIKRKRAREESNRESNEDVPEL